MAEIELINVHKSWGNFNAVVDFNLIIKIFIFKINQHATDIIDSNFFSMAK